MSQFTGDDIGRSVVIELKDGTGYRGTIVSVTDTHISIFTSTTAYPIQIPIAEIRSAHIKEVNVTEFLLIGGIIAAFMVLVIALAKSDSFFIGGGP